MKFLQRINEKKIIKEIRKITKNINEKGTVDKILIYMSLNSIKAKSAKLLLKNLISADFYKNVFFRDSASIHFFDRNYDFIKNFH